MKNSFKKTTFVWYGKGKNSKKLSGEIEAVNIRFARAELFEKGINIIKIHRKRTSVFFNKGHGKIKNKDINLFIHQLSVLLSSGIPILQAITSIYQSCEKTSFKECLSNIKSNVRQGHALSSALKAYSQYFDNLTCRLIAAGEQSGTLEIMLERIAHHKTKLENLKRKIKQALFYPLSVVCVAVIVTSILLIFVVPQFEALFEGFGAQLPWLTQIVINFSNFLQRNGWWIILCIMAFISFVIVIKKRSVGFARYLDTQSLKIPIFGKILKNSIIARLTRTLSTAYANGVPLLDALNSVVDIGNNVVFREAVMSIRKNVSLGNTLHRSIQATQLFPNMVIQMIAIGEESGKLDVMLEKVADFHEAEVDKMIDGLSQLLEPVIMVILGIVIGGLVIAMYLPVFKLGMVV